jgi:hypothetical protein
MMENNNKHTVRNRMIIGFSILTVIALIHIFRVGQYLKGNLFTYYYSYASDIMIPFGLYFLLCINESTMRFFRKWYVKALFIFGTTTIIEILQLFGVYIVGVTFDILDILMYAIGVMIAVLSDRLIFKRFIPFWDFKN